MSTKKELIIRDTDTETIMIRWDGEKFEIVSTSKPEDEFLGMKKTISIIPGEALDLIVFLEPIVLSRIEENISNKRRIK